MQLEAEHDLRRHEHGGSDFTETIGRIKHGVQGHLYDSSSRMFGTNVEALLHQRWQTLDVGAAS